MKCLVAIKRVVDPYVHVRVKSDGTGVDTENVKMAMNPFDEIAVEEAVRLKERGAVSEIKVISIGEDKSQEILRQALALGADSSALIRCDKSLSPLHVAKTISKYVADYQPDIVIMGKQSIDGDNNQTGQMLSAILGWSQGTFISKVEIKDSKILVEREVDEGIETIELSTPAILTTDLRLNEPRYATLPNVMKAKSKPLDVIDINDYGLDLETKIDTVQVTEPETRAAGEMVADVSELIDKLKNEAKVI